MASTTEKVAQRIVLGKVIYTYESYWTANDMSNYKLNPDLMLEILNERHRQIEKGYSEGHDVYKNGEIWCNDILAYSHWARQMYRMASPEKYRRRMMQVAALAIAACESYDRAEEK